MRTGARCSVLYNNVISFTGLRKFSAVVLGTYIGRYWVHVELNMLYSTILRLRYSTHLNSGTILYEISQYIYIYTYALPPLVLSNPITLQCLRRRVFATSTVYIITLHFRQALRYVRYISNILVVIVLYLLIHFRNLGKKKLLNVKVKTKIRNDNTLHF